jgi:hypothetical protein
MIHHWTSVRIRGKTNAVNIQLSLDRRRLTEGVPIDASVALTIAASHSAHERSNQNWSRGMSCTSDAFMLP